MKTKSLIINFFGGIAGTFVLLVPALFFLTIYLDNSNINYFNIGRGPFTAYTFNKSNGGFGIRLGPGVFIIMLIGGILVLTAAILIQKFIKVQYYD